MNIEQIYEIADKRTNIELCPEITMVDILTLRELIVTNLLLQELLKRK